MYSTEMYIYGNQKASQRMIITVLIIAKKKKKKGSTVSNRIHCGIKIQ